MSDRRFEYDTVFRFSDEKPLALADMSMDLLAVLADEIRHDAYSDGDRKPDDPQFCDCLRRRVYAALCHFFDHGGNDVNAAMAIARDGKQHRCPRHAAENRQ